jgi:hypothetical protein
LAGLFKTLARQVVDRIGDGLLLPPCGVQVDQRCSRRAVAHAVHQLAKFRARPGGQVGCRLAKIMKMDSGKTWRGEVGSQSRRRKLP